MNPFSILGVPDNASLDICQKAYRRLAMQYHPDRNPSPSAEAQFKQIKAAWELIQGGFKIQVAAPPTKPKTQQWYAPQDVGWQSNPTKQPKPIRPKKQYQNKFDDLYEPMIGQSYVHSPSKRVVPSVNKSFESIIPSIPKEEKNFGTFNAYITEEARRTGFKVEVNIDGKNHIFDVAPMSELNLASTFKVEGGYVKIIPRSILE